MEDTDSQRGDAIVKMPSSTAEAEEALDLVESLLENFRIISPIMSGNVEVGFAYNPIPGAESAEGTEGPEGPEGPE